LSITLICFLASCTKDFHDDETPLVSVNTTDELKCKPQQLKIAVISDIHYLAPSLLKNGAAKGTAFQTYLNFDPKLLEFSDPIFRKVISQLKRERPDIVLIPGDLTKDGEKVSHEAVVRILHQLSDCGTKVYVTPGNHDINNPEAVAYNGNISHTTPTIQARDFSKIYADFGYKNAISRDANSLSYISQPYRGLWILAIDDCEYYDNTTTALVPGKIKPETMAWITGKLREASQKDITVLSMMHHGIIEHFTGQEDIDAGYVTDDWKNQADKLMNAGLKVMFTGHYHANDIAMLGSEGTNVLYDIETGSLVTPPSPYRLITLANNELEITTRKIASINYAMPGGLSFTDYSNAFITAHMDGYFENVFTNLYGMDATTASGIAPFFRDGWMAHYAGDELMPEGIMAVIDGLPNPLNGALYSIWTDLPPADNNLHINLN
jgi:predicted phosphodiesterase